MRSRRGIEVVPLVVLGCALASTAHPQSVAGDCRATLSAYGAPLEPIRPMLTPDSGVLNLLDKGYNHHSWPPSEVLDSAFKADSVSFLNTLAFMVTDHGYYFGTDNALGAAVMFRLRGGPAELVLWALGVASLDDARYQVLLALPLRLAAVQEEFLMRQACAIAVQLEALTPSIQTLKQIGAQDGAPQWYYAEVADLRLIRERLTGQRAADFERLILPIQQRADALRGGW